MIFDQEIVYWAKNYNESFIHPKKTSFPDMNSALASGMLDLKVDISEGISQTSFFCHSNFGESGTFLSNSNIFKVKTGLSVFFSLDLICFH